jgi:hypothetical protein
MKRNSNYRVTNLRTVRLHFSYPTLNQLGYDIICYFIKLQYMNCNLNELTTFTRYSEKMAALSS